MSISGTMKLLVILVMAKTVSVDDICLSNENISHLTFASMTPYKRVGGGPVKLNEVIPKGYNASFIWHLVKHGALGIPRHRIDTMEEKLRELRKRTKKYHLLGMGTLCDLDMKLLKDWRSDRLIPMDSLAPEDKELAGIASRFHETFPHLLGHNQTENEFLSVEYEGVLESMMLYVSSIYDSKNLPKQYEFLRALQFSEICGNYVNKIKKIDVDSTYKRFLESDEVLCMMSDLRKRLGFQPPVDDILTIYKTCRYHRAWYPKEAAPWCGVFTPSHLRVLEYAEDLKFYEQYGYAHTINYEQACDLGKDLLQQLKTRVEGKEQDVKARTYFAQDKALVPFITYLGLFRDKDPLPDDSVPEDRAWKTAHFASFSSNLAFILSRRDEDGVNRQNGSSNEWWVSAVLNEAPLLLPGCNTTLGCSWVEFWKHFVYLNNCDFIETCGEEVTRFPTE